MFNKTKMFLNKYKLENLAKHNLNNDITCNKLNKMLQCLI